MARALSPDLRERVIAAVDGGVSRRKAAALFKVSASAVIKWVQQFRQTGQVAAKPMGGDRRSRLTGERSWLLSRIKERPELTLEEIRGELAARGVRVGYGTVWRFCAGSGLSYKKDHVRRRTGPARRRRAPRPVAATAAKP